MVTPEQRTVLVTGASRNIGAGIARHFAGLGDRVALVARGQAPLEQFARELRADGGQATAIAGDVSLQDEVARILEAARAAYGPVDVVVNNAVARLHKPFLSSSTADIAAVFDVTLWGTIWMIQATLPNMIERGWGRVINIIGAGATRGAAGRVSLTTAKAGQAGLTRALALEVAGTGVTVNGVAPGLIDTARGEWTATGDLDESLRRYRDRAKRLPMGRMGEVREVAAACAFLASADASYITGHVLDVNGGDFT